MSDIKDKSNEAGVSALPIAELTISRPQLLQNGSDREFRRLVHGLFALAARHEAVRDGHAAIIGLPGIDYTVLISVGHLVVEEQIVSVNRVAEHLHLSGAFITTVINRLVNRGLVIKKASEEDRRRVELKLSEDGHRLLTSLAATQRQVNDVQFDLLSEEEFLNLLSTIQKLIGTSERAIQLQAFLASDRTTATAGETT